MSDDDYDFDDDEEIDDLACPACGHHETRSRDCQECNEVNEVCDCIDDMCQGSGYCIHGDGMSICRDCNGSGIERWCPKCGANYWQAQAAAERRKTKDGPHEQPFR
jgi:hypothetical protein